MDKAYFSPNVDEKLIRTNLMATVTNENYPYEKWVDPLDSRLLNLLEGVKTFKTIIWNNTPLSTISYRIYGTTSLVNLILMFNGFLQPQEIPMGTELKIPQINVQNLEAKPRKSQVNSGV